MKILYSAGNRPGTGIQLKRFLLHSHKHNIRIAAYATAAPYLTDIDWTLDALKTRNTFNKGRANELFGHNGVPNVCLETSEQLLDDVAEWMPDLVISDCEPICSHIAQTLEIPLWYCSPMHLLDGIVWEYSKSTYKSVLDKTMLRLQSMPTAERYLIYSPFGDVAMRPILCDGFEWTTPYVDVPKTFMSADISRMASKGLKKFAKFSHGYFCTGETSFIADAIYGGNSIYTSPSLSNPESLLNALFCSQYGLGVDLGSVDEERYAIRCLNNLSPLSKPLLSVQNYPRLHELLE